MSLTPFRFTLRTTFILITILCLLFGYVGWEYSWIKKRMAFLPDTDPFSPGGKYASGDYRPSGPMLSNLFSDRHYNLIVVPIDVDVVKDEAAQQALIKQTERLFPEARVESVKVSYSATPQQH